MKPASGVSGRKVAAAIAGAAGLLMAAAEGLGAQTIRREAFGVWVRGARYAVSGFPYRGVEIDLRWEDV